jgi:hypothetical protein
VASQLEVLKSITAKDNVHLTSSGYRSLAEGILREAANFDMPKRKGKHSLTGKQQIHLAEWHGFVCNNRVGKISGKVPKKHFGGRPHPYLKKNERIVANGLHSPTPPSPPSTWSFFLYHPYYLLLFHFGYLVSDYHHYPTTTANENLYTVRFVPVWKNNM